MLFQKRIDQLFNKAMQTRQSLVSFLSLTPSDPPNQIIRFRLSCLVWRFKQKYITDSTAYYISKKSYTEDVAKITALEDAIIKQEAYSAEALEEIKEAKEYLELIAGHRVRNRSKNRVY